MKAVMIIMAVFLFSCGEKNEKEKKANSIKPVTKPKIEVRLIGEMRTRRSYAIIQSMDNDKAIDSFLSKRRADNPTLGYQPDSPSQYLVKQFERLDLIKNEELLLKNFKKQTGEKTVYIDSLGRKIDLEFYHSMVTDHMHFKLLLAKDSVDIDTGATNLQDLDYDFLDVIPGGNKELVFLDDYYIMNGDNFDFKVYEIRINN
jgi:hypothetical protein